MFAVLRGGTVYMVARVDDPLCKSQLSGIRGAHDGVGEIFGIATA